MKSKAVRPRRSHCFLLFSQQIDELSKFSFCGILCVMSQQKQIASIAATLATLLCLVLGLTLLLKSSDSSDAKTSGQDAKALLSMQAASKALQAQKIVVFQTKQGEASSVITADAMAGRFVVEEAGKISNYVTSTQVLNREGSCYQPEQSSAQALGQLIQQQLSRAIPASFPESFDISQTETSGKKTITLLQGSDRRTLTIGADNLPLRLEVNASDIVATIVFVYPSTSPKFDSLPQCD